MHQKLWGQHYCSLFEDRSFGRTSHLVFDRDCRNQSRYAHHIRDYYIFILLISRINRRENNSLEFQELNKIKLFTSFLSNLKTGVATRW